MAITITHLQGGLGNQMFQYAAGRRLAQATNSTLLLDLEWYQKPRDPQETPRNYELGRFRVTTKTYRRDILSRLYRRLMNQRLAFYYEKAYTFDPVVLKLPHNSYIHGSFQSWKYFDDIRSILIEEFSLERPMDDPNQRLLEEIKANPAAISLHVRRGDYVTNKAAIQVLGATPLDYYERALAKIPKAHGSKVFVFSDDPKWCQQNLKINIDHQFLPTNPNGMYDMMLMAACKHNIIANSSFSWWGAWLNQNPHKTVVAPKRWFNDPSMDSSDLLPNTWVLL
jgi:hypothetical protein